MPAMTSTKLIGQCSRPISPASSGRGFCDASNGTSHTKARTRTATISPVAVTPGVTPKLPWILAGQKKSLILRCFLLLVVQEFHVAIRAARNLSAVQIINADAVLAAPCKASRLCRRSAQILRLLGRIAACLRMKARVEPTSQIGSATDSPADNRLSLFWT